VRRGVILKGGFGENKKTCYETHGAAGSKENRDNPELRRGSKKKRRSGGGKGIACLVIEKAQETGAVEKTRKRYAHKFGGGPLQSFLKRQG